MITSWRYNSRLLFQNSKYKWILIFCSLLFSFAVILPREQYKKAAELYKTKDIWIVNCQVSQDIILALEDENYIDKIYPLYELQAEVKSKEDKKSFVLYGIDRDYLSDTEEGNLVIFLPENIQEFDVSKQTTFLIGRDKQVKQQYMFHNVRRSKNNSAYIPLDIARKIIRETSSMTETYDGICIQISSEAAVQEVEKIVKQIKAESLDNLDVLKRSYQIGRTSLLLLLFYFGTGIVALEVLIFLMAENMWYTRQLIVSIEAFGEVYRKKVKRYLVIKMNSVAIYIVGTAIILMITGVIY